MRGLVLAHDKEGFVLIPAVLKPFKGNIGNDIRGVTGNFFDSLSGVHRWVVVGTLTLQNLPKIKARRITF